MEESGITKVISVRLAQDDSQAELEGEKDAQELEKIREENIPDEDIAPEEGRELPPGVDDPAQVSPEQLHPIRTERD
jgi:chromosome segregation protein